VNTRTSVAGWSWVASSLLVFVACGSHSSGNDSGGDSGSALTPGGGSSSSSGAGSSSGGGSSGDDGGGVVEYGDGAPPPSTFPAFDGGTVLLSVNASHGPARQFEPPIDPAPISPYVYGVNAFAAWETTTQWGLLRWGGDGFSSWNWTNNFGNSGSDYCFWQGQESGGSALAGQVVGTTYPSVGTAGSHGTASLITIPILDWVSSSAVTNNVWSGSNPPCPGNPSCSSGTANGYAANVGDLPFVSTDPSSKAFVANSATKPGTLCTCAGTGCGSACAVDTTGAVYENEYVNYMKANYGAMSAPVFIMLDNEPNYWPSTHPELWTGYTGTPGCGTSGNVTFADVVSYDSTFATMVKATWPTTKVFGPVVAQDGIIYGGDYSDPNLKAADGGVGTIFTDYYLTKMAAASVTAGHALIDSFDVHYYTSNGSTSQCLQVPRMFWDPDFKDFTAAETDSIDYGWSGQNDYFDTNLYPRQMIPRLQSHIAADYAGTGATAPGLSFSEYDPGCEASIVGGVAEADLLGIFGREGVYAATAWPLKSVTTGTAPALTLVNYVVAAFDLYRNYDGHGATVGDTTVYAQTSDVETSSVYAFTHSTDPTRMEVVAINKTASAMPVTVQIGASPSLTTATAYQLVSASAIGVTAVAAGATQPAVSCSGSNCTLVYTLPPTSATTIAMH
jgi:hypothetical protein